MDMSRRPGGLFVTFEGPEGGGKSTQIRRLADALTADRYKVWATREPGGTRVGELIRPILLGRRHDHLSAWTEALLFTAARSQHVDDVIRPRLQRKEIVLCDRYTDSTIAYQGYGRGLNVRALEQLQVEATRGLKPHLTLLLNLSVESGLARIRPSSRDRLDRETTAFHQRVRIGYQHMAAADPKRWREVDASASEDLVALQILELVRMAMVDYGIPPARQRSA